MSFWKAIRDPFAAFGTGLARLPAFEPSVRIQGLWQTSNLAVVIWAILLFALTNPFYFLLTGQDPTNLADRNVITMRREENSQLALYLVRVAVPAIGLMLAIGLGRLRSIGRSLLGLWPIIPLWTWMALSMLWSQSPQSTANGAVAVLLLIVSAALMYAATGPVQACRALVLSGAVMAFASIAMVLILPAHGIHQHDDTTQSVHAGLWRGVYFHKNQLGQMAAIHLASLAFCGRSIIASRLVRAGLAAVYLFLIAKSGSASALLIPCATVALTLVVVVLSRLQRLFALILFSLGGAFSALALNAILQMIGRDPTFSGRTKIWSIAYEALKSDWLIGFGYMNPNYGSFTFELSRRAHVYEPHNMYLDLVLALGMVGGVLFLFALHQSLGRARAIAQSGLYGSGAGPYLAALVIGWLIAGITESDGRSLVHVAALGYVSLSTLAVARVYPTLPGILRKGHMFNAQGGLSARPRGAAGERQASQPEQV